MIDPRLYHRLSFHFVRTAFLAFVLFLAACTPTATPAPVSTASPAPSATPVPASPTPTILAVTPSLTAPAAHSTATTRPSPTETSAAAYPSLSPKNVTDLQLVGQVQNTAAQALAWLSGSDSLALAGSAAVDLLTLPDGQEATLTEGDFLPSTLSVSPAVGQTAIARPDNSIDLLSPPAGLQAAPEQPSLDLIGHSGTVTSIAFSADGRWLASAAVDDTVRIWEAKTGLLLGGWDLPYWVANLSFSPDGSRLAGVDLQTFTIHIWHLDQVPLDTPAPLDRPLGSPPGEDILVWNPESIPALSQVVFSPDWSQVAWVARNTVQLMQVASGELGPAFQHEDFVNGISWSPDGSLLASAAAGTINDQFSPVAEFWDPQAGELVNTQALSEPVGSLGFSPDGSLLAILDAQGEVQFWAAPR